MSNTYWEGKGKYQKLYDKLYESLVPPNGECDTDNGEIIRIVSRLYYDIFNNGGWNFSAMKDWRIKLVRLSPPSMKKATERFVKLPPKDLWKNHEAYKNYVSFLDLYVDWAIMYVNYMENLKGLEASVLETLTTN